MTVLAILIISVSVCAYAIKAIDTYFNAQIDREVMTHRRAYMCGLQDGSNRKCQPQG